MAEIFVTSDQHFHHKNILRHCEGTRGHFSSVEEMNETLIDNFNKRVGKKDEVILLGDFAFAHPHKIDETLDRLNGFKYFILGNHDKKMRHKDVRQHFGWVEHYAEMNVGDRIVVMSHYPMVTWNKKYHGSFQLYGHTHGRIPFGDGRSMDVGVDTNAMMPYNIEEIFETLEKRT